MCRKDGLEPEDQVDGFKKKQKKKNGPDRNWNGGREG